MPDPLIYSKIKDFCVSELKSIIATNPAVFSPDQVTVYRQWQKDETNLAYPCMTVIEVGLAPETTGLMAGTTEDYYWMLPYNVLIQDRETGTLVTEEGKYMGWHQCLMDNFRQALIYDPTSGKPFVQAEVFPKPVFEPNNGRYLDVVGGMALKFWAIESRS